MLKAKAKAKDQWRGPLAWTLAPDDREALTAVSDKVKGKMESAKLLSAVITLANHRAARGAAG